MKGGASVLTAGAGRIPQATARPSHPGFTIRPLLALTAAACSQPLSVPVEDAGAAVTALRVEPAVVEAITGPGGGVPIQFVAYAQTNQGAGERRAEQVEWTLSNRSAGAIDAAGTFTPSSDNGGVSWVTARLAGVEAQATLTVRYVDAVVEGDVDRADFEGQDWAETPGMWAYPEDGVNLPRNTPGIHFQWQAPAEAEVHAWRLRFRSELTDLSLYTDAPEWTADEETWASLVSTNAGGSLTVDLWGVGASGAFKAPQRTITVNRMDARGSIFYWSTGAGGIVEVPYGGAATDYLNRATTGECTGCHAISSTGLMALTVGGGNKPLAVWDMEADDWQQDDSAGLLGNFKTFSPDGRWLLSTYEGELRLHDGETGAFLETVPTSETVTHVDWSPDGTTVALVATAEHSRDWFFGGGRIVTMPHLGDGAFGPLEDLYTPPAEVNAYYPAWSPDGAWLAFNVSMEDAYDDETATLMVMPAAGGPAVALEAANLADGLTNSWPRWGPLPDDDILWLAFSSRRSYGLVTEAIPQIWVTAIDPERAAAGEDPSWPAFWLPGQDPELGNHIPVWAE